jgi:HSP20 family molecular chaperone IbpA
MVSRSRRGSFLDGDSVTEHVRDLFYLPAYPNSFTRPQGPFVDDRGAVQPHFEVSEGEDGTLHLTMEVPGISSRDLNVELENDHVLRIHGVRIRHRNGRISESKFEHSIRLKDTVDPERMEANLSSGVLTITVPQKPTKIRKLPLSTDERSILDTPSQERIQSSEII